MHFFFAFFSWLRYEYNPQTASRKGIEDEEVEKIDNCDNNDNDKKKKKKNACCLCDRVSSIPAHNVVDCREIKIKGKM
jgi:hypothetical protein